MLLRTGEAHFRWCYKPNFTFDFCWGIFESYHKAFAKCINKAQPAQNFELKKLFENENLKINKHRAEHHGPLFYPLKSLAALKNLVRLSLSIEIERKRERIKSRALYKLLNVEHVVAEKKLIIEDRS